MIRKISEQSYYSDIPPLTDEFFENAILRVAAAQALNQIQLYHVRLINNDSVGAGSLQFTVISYTVTSVFNLQLSILSVFSNRL
ncbi:MAG: hypothetical protein KA714_24650 [Limnoraphis sp. WC205]|jgi:hypothetical protein|nr:hypothetical protein [Limnoraphis sp. WC205]